MLFLAHLLPWPLDGGSQIKSYHTLRVLSHYYDITLLALVRRPGEITEDARAELEPYCRIVGDGILLRRGKLRNALNALLALIGNYSFLVRRDGHARMRALVRSYLAGDPTKFSAAFDVIHVDHLQMMQYVPRGVAKQNSTAAGTKVVLDNHNVEYRIPKRLSEASDAGLWTRWYAAVEWKKLRKFEAQACRRADLVLTVSDEDRDTLIELAPDALRNKVVSVPIGIDLEYWANVKRRPAANSILSIGTMFWPPNIDAVRWFCGDILPLIRAELPMVRFVVVGPKPTATVRSLANADPFVEVTGWVPDVRPYAERDGGVFVVPLRSGSGMRVKILTAMAMGLPVVSTTVGAEGIDVTDGIDIILADAPDRFASAVVSLLRDSERAGRLGGAGKRLIERSYSWNAAGTALIRAYQGVNG